MNTRANQEGFTLIELMIVVAIVAILAAIAIPLYLNFTSQAQTTGALSLTNGPKAAVEVYYNSSGTYPSNNTVAGVGGSIMGKYVESVTINDGVITATFCTNNGTTCTAAADLGGHTLIMSPSATGGSITWICKVDDDAIYQLVPTECRHDGGS